MQPALYEAFGLTVVEAMTCGLPVFATNRGGPAEIIVDGESGFHIDPFHGEQAATKMADFFEAVHDSDEAWRAMSDAALERIRTKCGPLSGSCPFSRGQLPHTHPNS